MSPIINALKRDDNSFVHLREKEWTSPVEDL